MNYQKIIQAVKLARMVKRAVDLKFEAVNNNGYFVNFDNKPILEFNTFIEAQNYTEIFNSATSGAINTYISSYEQKIDDILNA